MTIFFICYKVWVYSNLMKKVLLFMKKHISCINSCVNTNNSLSGVNMETLCRASQYWLEVFIFPISRANASGTLTFCSPGVYGFENSIFLFPTNLSPIAPHAEVGGHLTKWHVSFDGRQYLKETFFLPCILKKWQ